MLRSLLTGLLIGGVMAPLALQAEGESAKEMGRELVKEFRCDGCHGMDGNGTSPPLPEYPKLAGLDADYIVKQLEDFTTDLRPSPFMTPFAIRLDEEQRQAVAAWFSSQTMRPEPPRDPELVARGEVLHFEGNPDSGVPACAGCHGDDARGQPRFPRLAGQHPDYAYREMKRFKTGERDNDSRMAMQRVVMRMTDEEKLATAEYHATLD